MKVKKNHLIAGAFFLIILIFAIYLIFKSDLENFYRIVKYGNVTEESIGFFIDNSSTFENYYSAGQKKMDVLHYSLHLELFPEFKTVKGKTVIKLKAVPGEKLILNFYDNMKIDYVLLNEDKIEFTRDDRHIYISNTTQDKQDTVMITVKYSGSPESMGFGSFEFGDYKGMPVVYSLNEPVFASTWFPCNDLPTDKATADIFITNDSSFVSVSNGKLIDVQHVGDKATYHWKIVYPISTYLISVYSAKYVHFQDVFVSQGNDSMKVEYFVFPDHLDEAEKDFKINVDALKIFSSMFGTYPFIKEKYGVAEFLWQLGAIEHQTITGIGSNFLSGRNFFDDVYIHELAHQWWGDAVTVKSWKDIWLSEGFATYSEALFYEKKSGRDALISTMMSKFGNFEGKRLYNPVGNLFDRSVYNKGAWVLHMLRNKVGDENFFEILKNYFDQFKYKNASTEDFMKVCEKISGMDLNKFFDQWIFTGKGIPVLEYEFSVDSLDTEKFRAKINLKQIQNGYEVYELPVDFRLRGYNGQRKDSAFVMDTRSIQIKLISKFNPIDVSFDPENKLLAKFKNK